MRLRAAYKSGEVANVYFSYRKQQSQSGDVCAVRPGSGWVLLLCLLSAVPPSLLPAVVMRRSGGGVSSCLSKREAGPCAVVARTRDTAASHLISVDYIKVQRERERERERERDELHPFVSLREWVCFQWACSCGSICTGRYTVTLLTFISSAHLKQQLNPFTILYNFKRQVYLMWKTAQTR